MRYRYRMIYRMQFFIIHAIFHIVKEANATWHLKERVTIHLDSQVQKCGQQNINYGNKVMKTLAAKKGWIHLQIWRRILLTQNTSCRLA